MELTGRFHVRERIGRGGSSAVHRAFDLALDRAVAVKILHQQVAGERLARFVAEARTTARLDHPGIVPVHALGRHPDGRWYFAMKAVEGQTLTRLVREAPDWPSRACLERVVEVLVKVADALAFAHAHGVVHRDVKPDNIMVGSYGQVYLMDWGVARAGRDAWRDEALDHTVRAPSETQDGQVVGTPEFMAPEQAHGRTDEVDARTDVFSLGATLWFALTRRAPFERASLDEALGAARVGHVPDPRVARPGAALPAGLCRIARRAMAPRPQDRHPDVTALRDDLVSYLRCGERVQHRRVAAGTWVVRQGDEAREAYRIVSGRCRVVHVDEDGRESLLRELGPGEPFGEVGVLGHRARTASVVAVGEVLVEVVRAEDVDAWLQGDAWLAPFVSALAVRFEETDAALDVTARRAATLALENALLRAVLQADPTPWPELALGLAVAHGVDPSEVEAAVGPAGLEVVDGRLASRAPRRAAR